MGEVDFEESAMFYASFYFALLRHPRSSEGGTTSQRLIDFVDTFQRTKGAYLALGGNGAYRLCFWWRDDFKEVI
jgi:tartrate dehydratase beta subunit/fumarate hydratase class I family protein